MFLFIDQMTVLFCHKKYILIYSPCDIICYDNNNNNNNNNNNRTGKCNTWDVTVIDTLASSYVPATSQTPGAAAETAADRKTSKYAVLRQSYLLCRSQSRPWERSTRQGWTSWATWEDAFANAVRAGCDRPDCLSCWVNDFEKPTSTSRSPLRRHLIDLTVSTAHLRALSIANGEIFDSGLSSSTAWMTNHLS